MYHCPCILVILSRNRRPQRSQNKPQYFLNIIPHGTSFSTKSTSRAPRSTQLSTSRATSAPQGVSPPLQRVHMEGLVFIHCPHGPTCLATGPRWSFPLRQIKCAGSCYTRRQLGRASHRRTGAETVSADERCPSEHGGRSVSSARFSGTSENTRQTDEVGDSLLEFIGYMPAAVGYVVGEVIVKDQ